MYELFFQHFNTKVPLTQKEQETIKKFLTPKKIRRKQYLLQEGDISRYEYFVNKGCLRTYTIDEKGQEHIIQFAIEDWWTGDMYSFLTQTPARYTIDAIEDSELFCLEKNGLEELYIKVPKFEKFFRHLLQNAFIALQERIIANLSQPADERYCTFITKYPDMEKRLPLKQIAAYLGITPESLSRIRSSYIKSNKPA